MPFFGTLLVYNCGIISLRGLRMGKLGWFLGGYFLHSIFSGNDKEQERQKLELKLRKLELEKEKEPEKDTYVFDPNKKWELSDWIVCVFWALIIIIFIVLFIKVMKIGWLFVHILDAPK